MDRSKDPRGVIMSSIMLHDTIVAFTAPPMWRDESPGESPGESSAPAFASAAAESGGSFSTERMHAGIVLLRALMTAGLHMYKPAHMTGLLSP